MGHCCQPGAKGLETNPSLFFKVVCRELGWGPPLDIAGYATDFLGSQTNYPLMSCEFDMTGGGVVNPST